MVNVDGLSICFSCHNVSTGKTVFALLVPYSHSVFTWMTICVFALLAVPYNQSQCVHWDDYLCICSSCCALEAVSVFTWMTLFALLVVP